MLPLFVGQHQFELALILTSKTTQRKRGLRGTTLVSVQDQGKLERMLPDA